MPNLVVNGVPVPQRCPHTSLESLPQELIDQFAGSSCQFCDYSGKNQWLCLYENCHFIGCGPKGQDHSSQHAEQSNHPVAVNLHNSLVFCLKCESKLSFTAKLSNSAGSTTQESQQVVNPSLGLPCPNNTQGSHDTLLTSTARPPGVCGLPNLGNTCYLNAALQALSNCPQVTEHFLQCSGIDLDCRFHLASYYLDFLANVWLNSRSMIVSPSSILREIKYWYPMFSGYAQHDSQEFLRVFLNRLHDELKRADLPSLTASSKAPPETKSTICDCQSKPSTLTHKGKTNKRHRGKLKQSQSKLPSCPVCSSSLSADPSTGGDSGNTTASSKPKPVGSDGHSIVTDVFQGKLISAVRCLSCKNVSCREEVFLDLSLSLRRPFPTEHPSTKGFRRGSNIRPFDCLQPQADADSNQSSVRSYSGLRPARGEINDGHTISAMFLNNSISDTTNIGSTSRFSTNPLQQLIKFRDSMPFIRRMLAPLFGFIALSISWIFARLSDVQDWMTRPNLSLDDCLSDFFSQAELNGENKYYCERCKKLCNGLNQTALVSLPEVLCIHLKRFRSHCMDSSKINSPVTFPLEGLELGPYLHTDCTDKVTTFDLISVICHRGGYGGGHYVTYSLNAYTQSWYEFDDDHVTQVPAFHVEQLTSDAYILFYSRAWFVRFSTWAEPGPIDNTEFLCEHGQFKPTQWNHRDSLLVPIPHELWTKLLSAFGGGPVLRNPSPCSVCHEAIIMRQRNELQTFEKLFKQCEPVMESCGIFAVSNAWFDLWKDFVEGKSLIAPGPIDNNDIVEYRSSRSYFNNSLFSSRQTLSSQPRLKESVSYSELFEECWVMLRDIYGGGPAVCVRAASGCISITPTDEDEPNGSLAVNQSVLTVSPSNVSLLSISDRGDSPDSSRTQPPLTSDSSSHSWVHQGAGDSAPSHTYTSPLLASKTDTKVLSINGDTESGIYSNDRVSYTTLSIKEDYADGDRSSFSDSLSYLDVSYRSHSVENLLFITEKTDWKQPLSPSTSNSINGFSTSLHTHSMEHLLLSNQQQRVSSSVFGVAGDGPNKLSRSTHIKGQRTNSNNNHLVTDVCNNTDTVRSNVSCHNNVYHKRPRLSVRP
ncbi:Ubiquitin carboxyl-terminal hydrolase 20 [Clonorchis sinensis]|uniref:ubiquitinyl hydrolase 1 n=1 Tax=Clonorchis sinensis TaxID=79923 RepID=A0A8T1MNZ6_CLOSI|nr:Ubiquitin carboxyl-terminal hydrolase 20 [Clonorchis sinensis]